MKIQLDSEVGHLEAVVVHSPGREVENMTPQTARDVLYDDIVSLPLAEREHRQLTGVLSKVAKVYELRDLLATVLEQERVREALVRVLCQLFNSPEHQAALMALSPTALAAQLIEGTPKIPSSLEKFLAPDPYALPPLPNMFFTRDATMALNDRIIIGSMAYRARQAEALILKAIFKYHPQVSSGGFYFDGTDARDAEVTIEGGDLLVVRQDLVMIGYSERTSVAGIDRLMRAIASEGPVRNFIVVEIPKTRASIHLDMLFTLVDHQACVVYPPLVFGTHRSPAYHCRFADRLDDDGQPVMASIAEHSDVLAALASVGIDLQPIACGGADALNQDREQWSSGANFFAFGPGQVLGYRHNRYTLDAMSAAGFEVIDAEAVIQGQAIIAPDRKVVVSMDGAELSRGGGGCRCMTLPISRRG
jgi:arginine deiminase